MLPNASDLASFLEVANTRNMSRAAERLGLTQPALSQAMKRLEHSFDQQLLLRGKAGVSLTKSGEKLALKAKALLEEWQKLKDEAGKDQAELRGRYSLGIHSSVGIFATPHFVPQLMADHPGLELRLVHDLSRKITEDVISFKLDFGITVNPVAHPDLVIRELYKDEVTFYKSIPKNVNNDLKSESKVLIIEPDLAQSQDLMAKLARKKIQFNRTITSSSLEVIKSLVMAGAGIGILPGRVVGDEKNMKAIEGMPKFQDRHCLIYRADMQKSLAAKTLTAHIQKCLKES